MRSKLNLKQVREIRESNLSQRKLAEMYNVNYPCIFNIIHNIAYHDPDYTPPIKNKIYQQNNGNTKKNA